MRIKSATTQRRFVKFSPIFRSEDETRQSPENSKPILMILFTLPLHHVDIAASGGDEGPDIPSYFIALDLGHKCITKF